MEEKIEETKVNKKSNKKVILIVLAVVAIFIAILVEDHLNNPVTRFERNLDNADVSELQEIYQKATITEILRW